MLRWLPIVWANLKRRKLRLAFTFISILLAFLMFGMLDALRTSLAGVVNIVGADRVLVQSKINMIMPLPRGHYEKIRALNGVKAAASFNWFGGLYKDAKHPIQMHATDPRSSSRVSRVKLKPEEITAWERNRQGMIIGPLLANSTAGRWATGFRFDRRSGANSTARIPGSRHRRHLRRQGHWCEQGQRLLPVRLLQRVAAIRQGSGRHDRRARNDPRQSDAVAARIDAQFENSPAETKTATERQFVKRLLDQVGNIGPILVSVTSAVFFTMLLVTANTMAQSVSERTNEIGVLKTLGFGGVHPDAGAARVPVPDVHGRPCGAGVAWFLASGVGVLITDYFPSFGIGASTFMVGLSLMLAFGIITGAWPALTAMRLNIVDALRRV